MPHRKRGSRRGAAPGQGESVGQGEAGSQGRKERPAQWGTAERPYPQTFGAPFEFDRPLHFDRTPVLFSGAPSVLDK